MLRWWRALLVLALVVPAAVAFSAAFPAALYVPRREAGHAPAVPAALFSHRMHGVYGCYACHPSIFPQAPLAFTHEEMRAGRFCARCHDGARAIAIAVMDCGGCHVSAP